MKELKWSLVLFLLLLPLVSAADSQEVAIRFYAGSNQTNLTIKDTCSANGFPCDATFTCNVTVIKPNQNYLFQQQPMFKQGDIWNYIQSNNSILPYDLGVYEANVYCQNSTAAGENRFHYEITLNGRSPPSSSVILGYTLIFIILISGLLFCFLYAIGGIVSLKVDVLDVALNVGFFFGFLAYKNFSAYYLGNALINMLTDLIMEIAIYTNVIFPIIGFIMTILLGPYLMKKYPNIFGRMPGYKPPYDPDTGEENLD